MFATIRSCTRKFKAAVRQIHRTKKKIDKIAKKKWFRVRKLAYRYRKKIYSYFISFWNRKRKKADPILIQHQAISKNKIKNRKTHNIAKSSQKSKPSSKQIEKNLKKTISMEEHKKEKHSNNKIILNAHSFENFYKEWEASWGPALTRQDKEFLESASPDLAIKVMENGREMLKSPYLKAVYNGLKDLQNISDLNDFDRLAKEKMLPYLKDYYERKPEQFYEMICAVHDKGVFKTRSGDRRLSLDPRLIPTWLGLELAS